MTARAVCIADQLADVLKDALARAGEVLVRHGVDLARITSVPGKTSPRYVVTHLRVDGWTVFSATVAIDAGAIVEGSLTQKWSPDGLRDLGLYQIATLVDNAGARGAANN